MTTEKPKRQKADWEAIERDYRTGQFSDQELANKHGNVVTRQAISKRAREKGWTKDLTAAVRQATRAKLIQDEVAKRVAGEVASTVAGNVAESFQATTNTVLAAAEVAKDVILRHRGDIAQARELAMDMLGELKLATHSQSELIELFRQAQQGLDADAVAAMQQSIRDMLKLHNRVGSLHKLAETFNKLQPLERKAFNLDDDGGGEGAAGADGRVLTDAERAVRLSRLLAGLRERRDAAKGEGADG